MIQNRPATANRPPIAGPILCFGFLTAVLMWCAWYVERLSGLDVPAWAGGAVLLAILWAGMTAAGIAVGARRAIGVGIGAGVLASALNLLILASTLVEQPEAGAPAPGVSGLRPGALVYIPGFLAFGGAVGLVAAVIAARIESGLRSTGRTVEGRVAELERRWPAYWLSRFAIVTVVTIVPLLLIGGSVTSTRSGMAVPGWPDSYGANMFLFPISLMTGRVLIEHAHRLFGALAGLTTLVLMVYSLTAPATAKARTWAAGLLILVCVQGWLGGGRVALDNPYMGAVHGILAQLFLAAAVATAAFLSPLYQPGTPFAHDARDRRRKALATGLLHATILQLALGALFRHLKGVSPGAMHTLWTHAAFSLVVVVMALLAGFAILSRARGPSESDPIGPTLRRTGLGIVASVAAQFILGWLAFWVVLSGDRAPPPTADRLAETPPVPLAEAVIPTLHQANGALLLALAALAVVWTKRIWRDR